tara:strand:+ start:1015 stop:1269 length:255 start_codon:yes stop_codon:yes gene_type:complete
MFLSSEMKLVKKNYSGFYYPEQTIFVSNINPIKQIKFEKVLNEYNQYLWKISFPLKFSEFNYTTSFTDKLLAKTYMKKIINSYI